MRYRRAAKKDATHAPIVSGLRALGYSVLELHAVGGGVPDVLVGGHRVMCLMEIKTPGAVRPAGKVRADTLLRQMEWADAWRGTPVARNVETLEQACAAMAALR